MVIETPVIITFGECNVKPKSGKVAITCVDGDSKYHATTNGLWVVLSQKEKATE